MPHRITTVRPPLTLAERLHDYSVETEHSKSAIIRGALDQYRHTPLQSGASCPVKQLYRRTGQTLALTPVGFSCPVDAMDAYLAKAKRAKVSFGGYVSLALADLFAV
jgi:hypothetical protein